MTILPAILLASIFSSPPPAGVTCHGATVSYRFIGVAGTVFTYGGRRYAVPPSGWIELVREKETAYLAATGKSLPLDVWPLDAFGTRRVPLPKSEAPVTEPAAPAAQGASR
jgi:hypothetical protein